MFLDCIIDFTSSFFKGESGFMFSYHSTTLWSFLSRKFD